MIICAWACLFMCTFMFMSVARYLCIRLFVLVYAHVWLDTYACVCVYVYTCVCATWIAFTLCL